MTTPPAATPRATSEWSTPTDAGRVVITDDSVIAIGGGHVVRHAVATGDVNDVMDGPSSAPRADAVGPAAEWFGVGWSRLDTNPLRWTPDAQAAPAGDRMRDAFGPRTSITDVRWSADGERIALLVEPVDPSPSARRAGRMVGVLTVSTGEVQRVPAPADPVGYTAIALAGSGIVAAGASVCVQTIGGEFLPTVALPAGRGSAVHLEPTGETAIVWVTTAGGWLYGVDPAGGLRSELALDAPPAGLVLLGDGRVVVGAGSQAWVIAADGSVEAQVEAAAEIRDLAARPTTAGGIRIVCLGYGPDARLHSFLLR